MKFTKKDISDIKYFYNKAIMRELLIEKNIPEFTYYNLIRYGILIGKILTIIRRRINLKKIEENENADELIKETFGAGFCLWLNKINKMLNGNTDNNIDNSND